MWIKRLTSQVQGRGLWVRQRTINRGGPCDIPRHPEWENPVRITSKNSFQTSLIFVNELLSFKNSETIEAGLPHPLTNG